MVVSAYLILPAGQLQQRVKGDVLRNGVHPQVAFDDEAEHARTLANRLERDLDAFQARLEIGDGRFHLPQELLLVVGRMGGNRADVRQAITDRKSTRLNSSHSSISYAVFCLKKK